MNVVEHGKKYTYTPLVRLEKKVSMALPPDFIFTILSWNEVRE